MPPLGLPIYGQPAPQREPEQRWRSLAEAVGAADPAAGTYPDGDEVAPESFGRRSFMQLLGASAALAGLGGCKPPRENVVGYVRQPPSVTPSVPSSYATAIAPDGYGVGVVVTSWEGRPTKLEGNREHPASRGGSDAILQATTSSSDVWMLVICSPSSTTTRVQMLVLTATPLLVSRTTSSISYGW
jgi:molybdopterin-containing oxidoreductase family iron-sulfur binding subunit